MQDTLSDPSTPLNLSLVPTGSVSSSTHHTPENVTEENPQKSTRTARKIQLTKNDHDN